MPIWTEADGTAILDTERGILVLAREEDIRMITKRTGDRILLYSVAALLASPKDYPRKTSN